jgi:hypothetical protein
MPPFKALDPVRDEFIQYYQKNHLLQLPEPAGNYETFVYQRFLRSKGEPYHLQTLEKIKDEDLIPFRARNSLTDSLKTIRQDSKVKVLFTREDWLRRLGPEAFSNDFFIDHLHFNLNGQILLSKYISNHLLDWMNQKEVLDQINQYFSDKEMILKDLYFEPINEIDACYTIDKLISQNPYQQMIIQYKNNGIEQFRKHFNYQDFNQMINSITESLSVRQDWLRLKKHLLMINAIEPYNLQSAANLMTYYKEIEINDAEYQKYSQLFHLIDSKRKK